MSFDAPLWLWLVAAWPLLLLWLNWQATRSARPVADWLMWRRAADALGAPATARRFSRREAAALLPLVLLTLALAQPVLDATNAGAGCVVIVDRSASMGTTIDGRNRAVRGLDLALKMLGGPPRRMIGVPATPNSARLLEAGAATASADDLVVAARAAMADGASVVVVTDRVVDALPVGVGMVVVADAALNAGIVAAGWRAGVGLLVRVAGDAGAGRRTLTVTPGPAGAPLATFDLPDASDARVVIPGAALAAVAVARAPLRLTLTPGDALALDDIVDLVGPSDPVRVAMTGVGDRALERALRANPRLDVARGGADDAALVVGGGPAAAGVARLLVAPVIDVAGFRTGPAVAVAGAASGRGPWDGVVVDVAAWTAVHSVAAAPEALEVLLAVGTVPLLVRSGRTFVLLVDPDREVWARDPSFPRIIARLTELAGLNGDGGFTATPGGNAAAVPSGGAAAGTWHDPSAASWAVTAGADGVFRVVPDGVGVGSLEAGAGSVAVASAVLNPEATHAARREARTFRPAPARDAVQRTPLGPWCALAAAAAMLLTVARVRSTSRTPSASGRGATARRTPQS